jgi:hypothetical protein
MLRLQLLTPRRRSTRRWPSVPELQQSDIAQSINQLNQRFYSDQKRPQVDLVASYSLDGLAGRVNPLSGQDPIEFASTT